VRTHARGCCAGASRLTVHIQVQVVKLDAVRVGAVNVRAIRVLDAVLQTLGVLCRQPAKQRRHAHGARVRRWRRWRRRRRSATELQRLARFSFRRLLQAPRVARATTRSR